MGLWNCRAIGLLGYGAIAGHPRARPGTRAPGHPGARAPPGKPRARGPWATPGTRAPRRAAKIGSRPNLAICIR
eukprot:1043418-Pyramimonas_sp.AAC.1